MFNSNNKIGNTFTAVVCTILFSTTCVLSAVGPAQANAAPSPVVGQMA